MGDVSELLHLKVPCFSCQYAYSCKYWKNTLWCSYILKSKECAAKYPFMSLYEQLTKDPNLKKYL